MEATCSHLLFFSWLLLLSPRRAFSVDTLGKGSNITGTETLVSADGTFTMGFFSPGASSKRYYLGIWFTVSSDAVCWVANRDRPIDDKAGALVVSDTGILLVLDGSSQVKWSSNSTSASPVDAQLLNNGNLVVRNRGSNTVLWQSFDHPSNAMLSGMKVGTDFWDGAEWHLTSWRSADDPSPAGAFRRVLDTSGGLPDNVVWQGSVKTFRTGPWNGLWFSGIPEVFTYRNLIEYQMVITPREINYGYVVKPGAPPTYIVLTETGAVKRQVWDASSRAWHTYFKGPRDVCDDYGKCGAFGICNVSAASTSFCSCLKGFVPVSPSEWKGKEVSGGCRRNVTLNDCGGAATTDGFELLPGVKLPDTHNASVDMSITVEQCRARCLANCSCVAYAAADIGGGGAGSGCVIWGEDLIDLRYVDGGQDLYLRLPISELGPAAGQRQEHRRNRLVATLVPPAVVSLLTFVFLIWTGRVNLSHIICCYAALDLATIRRATGNFSVENVIGDGAFGIVYQGKLPRLSRLVLGYPGRIIAVKRLKPIPGLPDRIAEYFTREVKLMATVGQHPNVLQFLAYCEEDGEKILVYEYMPRRSLDIYIFGDRRKRALLDWNMRLKIIQQIAMGVDHLSSGNVIHRDLKPANVLLDDGWNAKVADFGTARLYVARATGTRRSSATQRETSAPGETSTRTTRTIIGTPAYMAPEYARDVGGQTTPKCDVYSFGVTLLETLGGRKNSERPSVVSTVRREWAESNDDRDIMSLLDSAVEPSPSAEPEVAEELSSCIQIGLLCVQENPVDRPNMSEVVTMLSTRATLPEPVIPVPLPLPLEEEDEDNSNMASLQEARLSRPAVYETVDLT